MRKWKRGLAALLAAIMLSMLFPASVLADVVSTEDEAADPVETAAVKPSETDVLPTDETEDVESSEPDALLTDETEDVAPSEPDTLAEAAKDTQADEVIYNLGTKAVTVSQDMNQTTFDEDRYAVFDQTGGFTIELEENAFFPYEVQFTRDGRTWTEWFLEPNATVEIDGHVFAVHSARTDPYTLVQAGFEAAGEYVPFYPEEKTFTNDGAALQSLMPLPEVKLTANLPEMFPAELKAVPFKAILGTADPDLTVNEDTAVVWTRTSDGDQYTVASSGDTIDLSDSYYSGITTTELEMIVGSPHQLDLSNIRYIVTIHSRRVHLDNALEMDAVYADGAREAFEIPNKYFSVYYDYGQMRFEICAYRFRMRSDWAVKDVFLSMRKAEGRLETFGAEVYTGTYETLEDLLAAGSETENITSKVWNKTVAQLQTEPESSLYRVDIYASSVSDRPGFTIVWTRDGTPVDVTAFDVDAYRSYHGYSVYFYTDLTKPGDSSFSPYWDYTYDEETNFSTRIYKMPSYRYPANDPTYTVSAYCEYQDETWNRTDLTAEEVAAHGIKAVAGNVPYETWEAAAADGLTDISAALFGDGYAADYSQGVVFTVFAPDGTAQVRRLVRTVDADGSDVASVIGLFYQDSSETWKRIDTYSSPHYSDDVSYPTFLYRLPNAQLAVNGQYAFRMEYQRDRLITPYADFGVKAVAGIKAYETWTEAQADGKSDIAPDLFGAGYLADYSAGVVFSVFNAKGEMFYCTAAQTLSYRPSVSLSSALIYSDGRLTDYSYRDIEDYYYSGYVYRMPSADVSPSTPCTLKATFQSDKADAVYTDYQVTAYAGTKVYRNKAEATADDARDISAALFGSGYTANFSGGVFIYVFDADGGILTSRYVKTEDYLPDAAADFQVTGARSTGGSSSYTVFTVGQDLDSYYNNGCQTLLILKDQGSQSEPGEAVTDTEILAEYQKTEKASVYYNGVPLTSSGSGNRRYGEHQVPFNSGSALKYEVSPENKKLTNNYWVTLLTRQSGGGKLFVNGANVSDYAGEDGKPRREIILSRSMSKPYHDVFFANVGDEDLTGIKVSLVEPEYIALDDYWTVRDGAAESSADTLKPFNTLAHETMDGQSVSRGYFPNIGRIRLIPMLNEGVGAIKGTLVVEAANGDRTEIALSGIAGDIRLDDAEPTHAVKYVPYSFMLGTNNMYKGDGVSMEFSIVDGELPDGVTLLENGEIYGVPKEEGEFTFMVEVHFSYTVNSVLSSQATTFTSSAQHEYTLTVETNSDENVDGATDADGETYRILNWVPDMTLQTESLAAGAVVEEQSSTTRPDDAFAGYRDIVFRSNAPFEEFIDFWLDGDKLVRGTDYTVEEGSTKVVVQSKTFQEAGEGTHTIAAEFRVGGDRDNDLKRTGQNYTTKVDASVSLPEENKVNDNTHSSSPSRGSTSSSSRSVTVASARNGRVTVSSTSPKRGQEVTITVTPNDGYRLDTLSVTGSSNRKVSTSGSGNTYTFTMPSYSVTVRASFTPASRSITVSAVQNGTVNVPTSATVGSTVTITATPNKGYVTDAVRVNTSGSAVSVTGTGNQRTFTMPDANVTVSVSFTAERLAEFVDISGTDWFFEDAKWAYSYRMEESGGLIRGVTTRYWEPQTLISSITAVVTLERLEAVDLSQYYAPYYTDENDGFDSSAWYVAAARWAKVNGILLNDRPFGADEPLTRGEYAVMLRNFLRHRQIDTTPANTANFSDAYRMTPDEQEAFQFLNEAGIFLGDRSGAMLPQNHMKRSHLAALLHRLSNYVVKVEMEMWGGGQ